MALRLGLFNLIFRLLAKISLRSGDGSGVFGLILR